MGLLDRMNGVDASDASSSSAQNSKKTNGGAAFDLEPLTQAMIDAKSKIINDVAIALAKIDVIKDEDLTSLINESMDSLEISFNAKDRSRLIQDIKNEVDGLGPLERLLCDSTITEIMVNGPKKVYVEKNGKLVLSGIEFENDEHVRRIIDRIVAPLGRRIDDSSPMVDARLADGSRVNAIIPPISLVGPSITIRKFSATPLTIDNLIGFGSLNKDMGEFLRACVIGRLNILVSGGTGSGKTTLLNVLSSFIPETERIVTIEDAAELRLEQDHVVSLESRPANLEGKGAVTIRDLVRNALRMRPDRIVVGECRGGETLDMLQAMNTGHDGSLTTLHANTPRDAFSRVETMCLMAGMDLPSSAIRQQAVSAIDIVVQQARLRDGTRKITSISEVVGMEGDTVIMNEIFTFRFDGYDDNNKILGEYTATGIPPSCKDKMIGNGAIIKDSWFIPAE